jgi:hypothetical protein
MEKQLALAIEDADNKTMATNARILVVAASVAVVFVSERIPRIREIRIVVLVIVIEVDIFINVIQRIFTEVLLEVLHFEVVLKLPTGAIAYHI